ncbi:MAG: aromatic amino acid transport family protein [Candidatus Omnitrophota bacterium]
MNNKPTFLLVVLVAFFVMGNLVGAGILGLPIQAGFAGFIPCLAGIVLVGAALFFTGVVLSDEAIRTKNPKFHYPSLYQAYLGFAGKWIAVISNLIILYGFLIVYISGATIIIKELTNTALPGTVIMLIFFAIVTGLTVVNPRALRHYNALFVVLLWLSFAIIVIIGEKQVDLERLRYMDWKFLPVTIPILITALSFHNIIPNICKDLKWDRRAVLTAMTVGVLAGYLITTVWCQVSLGALPLDGKISIASAFGNNFPSTVPLSEIVKSPLFVTSSLLFALMAIITSYLSNGYAIMEFMNDLMSNYFKKSNRLLTIILSFGPPLVIALIYPNIFLNALDMVGGLGIVVLFGILPSIIAVIRARSSGKKSFLGIVMVLLFLAFLFLKIGKETGILRVKPGERYVRYNFTHYAVNPLSAAKKPVKKPGILDFFNRLFHPNF